MLMATSDWLEIFNGSVTPVNLAGWHLTDSASNPALWTFPATNLPAGGYLIVFCFGKNRPSREPSCTSTSTRYRGDYSR